MNKEVYNKVSNKADGKCGVCHQYYGDRLELHHILRRRVEATTDNCIMLCGDCHRGTNGIHGKNGHILDIKLKQEVQQHYFDIGMREKEVRKLMSDRLY